MQRRNSSGTGRPSLLLALEMLRAGPRGNYNANWLEFRILRPNIATMPTMKLADLRNNYRQVKIEEARPLWEFWYGLIVFPRHGM